MKNLFLNLGIIAGFVLIFSTIVYFFSIFWAPSLGDSEQEDLSGFFELEVDDGISPNDLDFIVVDDVTIKRYLPEDFDEKSTYKSLVFFDYGYPLTETFFEGLNDVYVIYRFEVQKPDIDQLKNALIKVGNTSYVDSVNLVSFELASLYSSENLNMVDQWIDIDGSVSVESTIDMCNENREVVECFDDEFVEIDVLKNLENFSGTYRRINVALDEQGLVDFGGDSFVSLDESIETSEERDLQLVELVKNWVQ